MDNRTWFKQAQYGMMAHWGLYSLLAGEWRGRRVGLDYAEWIQSRMPIPNAEYEQLANEDETVYYQTIFQALSEGVQMVERYLEGAE